MQLVCSTTSSILIASPLIFYLAFLQLRTLFQPLSSQVRLAAESRPPISRLVAQAQTDNARFEAVAPTLKEAASIYRERRGRHPPSYFDAWHRWAIEHDAPIHESFFDQIYHDLELFWAVPPAKIRRDAASWPMILTVRNGEVKERTEFEPTMAAWLPLWRGFLEGIPAAFLPDVDIALNKDDEAHIFVPWNEMQQYMKDAAKTKQVLDPDDVDIINRYAKYPPAPAKSNFHLFPDGPSEPDLWLLARDTCPPDSEARSATRDEDLTIPASFPSPTSLGFMRHGFVSNWTASKSPCNHPSLRNLHGYLVSPKDGSKNQFPVGQAPDRLTTRTLFPLFSVAKVQGINNDILIPAAIYGNPDLDVADKVSWTQKAPKAIWRGGTTGGVNNATNWTRMHRHRMVSMMNGTQVDMQRTSTNPIPEHAPGGDPPLPYNFRMPDASVYPLASLGNRHELGRWVSSFADAAFTLFWCWPLTDWWKNGNGKHCPYTDEWYHSVDVVPSDHFFKYKYLPDVDGHGYSGRFRTFLMSDSLPIKATIWSEWHDSRLVAWKHFVPMDNTYMDWFGLMEFFVGYQPAAGVRAVTRPGHDEVARQIAEQGRDWARKAMRREDIVLYMWRLILEYARICDEQRERMGWVDDLR